MGAPGYLAKQSPLFQLTSELSPWNYVSRAVGPHFYKVAWSCYFETEKIFHFFFCINSIFLFYINTTQFLEHYIIEYVLLIEFRYLNVCNVLGKTSLCFLSKIFAIFLIKCQCAHSLGICVQLIKCYFPNSGLSILCMVMKLWQICDPSILCIHWSVSSVNAVLFVHVAIACILFEAI